MKHHGEDKTSAPQIFLEERQSKDFAVTIVKDSSETFGKDARYHPKGMTTVGVGTEQSGDTGEQFMQVHLALAYALTIHKAQGITMLLIYSSLIEIFGFGMPYTLMTSVKLYVHTGALHVCTVCMFSWNAFRL